MNDPTNEPASPQRAQEGVGDPGPKPGPSDEPTGRVRWFQGLPETPDGSRPWVELAAGPARTVRATRRLQFAIGHRVLGHEGKCAYLHGHNFVFLLTAEAYTGDYPMAGASGLDDLGRVIDFGVLKARLGGWLERAWDHGMLLSAADVEAIAAMSKIQGQKLYLLPYNPTAENVARYILDTVGPLVLGDTRVRLVRVEVWETENGKAEASV